eukprot:tig00000681_g3117.t1
MSSTALFVFLFSAMRGSIVPALSCKLQYILTNSMIFKHVIGFFAMLTFVVMPDPDYEKESFLKQLGINALYYTWFLLLSRSHWTAILAVLAAILANYVLTLRIRSFKKRQERPEEHRLRLLPRG